MSHYNDLPGHDHNHEIEDKAIAAFHSILTECKVFILQASDRKDYGADCQIEVMADGCATNARIHVQLKGTESALNADGSLSIGVQRTNLNYLLMQPYSMYVAYHVPTNSLRIRMAESVARHYEHSGKNWTEQSSVTATFSEELTVERLCRLADLASIGARSARDCRMKSTIVAGAARGSHLLDLPVELHLPEERASVCRILSELHQGNADDVISANFEKFSAALGLHSDEMDLCYMSEINLGMDGLSLHPERIEDAIQFFRGRLTDPGYHIGGLYYTIGNAFQALRKEREAKQSFEAALTDPILIAMPELAAQIYQNLGSSLARLGADEEALAHYTKALMLSPSQAETHHSLAIRYLRLGKYEDALHHFDQVVFSDRIRGRLSSVLGWRANALFNLGDGKAAFREINGLVSQAEREVWIWPWCGRLVSNFGRSSKENAHQALLFWQRYTKANPEDLVARWELLMTTFYLRGQGEKISKSYADFQSDFDGHISNIDAEHAALLWDRLGHWAQDEENWSEAERCFRKAYELASGEYGYCLAIALNKLGRFDESIPLLQEQAEIIQPDALSWFQLATTFSNLARWKEAINAYERSLALDPDDALTLFELGGAHWNNANNIGAIDIWSTAIKRFPDHELAARLMHDLGALFGNSSSDYTSAASNYS